MAVFFDIDHLPSFRNAAITVGSFDGVHKGHLAIIKEVVDHAKMTQGESILITFEPHPRKLIKPNLPLGVLTPLIEKIRLIHEAGIQHIVVAPFTEIFAYLSAENYVKEFLVDRFHPHSIIVGYDHQFGHNREGNYQLLEQFAQQYRYQLFEIPGQLINDATVSSTKIRNALKSGRVDIANAMLGREYALHATVITGKQLGRTIGYPTANLQPNDADQLLPSFGVYAVRVRHQHRLFGGMLNIGTNPTVETGNNVRIEVHLFNFSEDIYDQRIEVRFLKKLRDEVKFPSLDALKAQLHKDKLDALDVLGME